MKHFQFGHMLVLTVLALALGLVACKKDEGPTDSGNGGNGTSAARFTLNGGGFTNQTFTMSSAVGGYEPEEGYSGVGAYGVSGSDSISLLIVFPGTSTGTFSWNDITGIVLVFTRGGTIQKVYETHSGTTVVTAYGAVGGTITGTFSGQVVGGSVPYTTIDTVTVSNGSFSAIRAH